MNNILIVFINLLIIKTVYCKCTFLLGLGV